MAGEGLIIDYRHDIDDKVRDLEKALGNGNAKSYEEYKAQCGEIRGLKRAKDIFNDALKRYASEEGEINE